jgi:single-strand DNA-binding protein
MARGINKVIIVGNLGNDPDVKYTQSGSTITTVSVATTEAWKDKQTGQQQERTEWHRVKFFGRLAEIAGEYLKKGRQVYVEGSLRTDKYTGKDGVERYTTDIIASEMQMLGGGGEGGGERGPRPQRQEQGEAPRRQGPPVAAAGAGAPAPFNDDFSDDDIPF